MPNETPPSKSQRVADNLRRDAGFYEKATLTYKVRVGEKLHTLLQEHGQLLL